MCVSLLFLYDGIQNIKNIRYGSNGNHIVINIIYISMFFKLNYIVEYKH